MDTTQTEREVWIDEEMTNALDAGCFSDRNDPELLAYAERGWEREIKGNLYDALVKVSNAVLYTWANEKNIGKVEYEARRQVVKQIEAALRAARGEQ